MSASPQVPSPDPAQLAARARRVLPGGSTHVARSYAPALYVTRAQGARKWLVDGREIVDYTMGHGALLLGHSHPAVVAAVQSQVARGTHFGAASPLEVEWAELITSMVSSAEEVRFTASGTEGVMLALRLCRAATGRDVVVKFHDHFHGWYDAVRVDLDSSGRPERAPGVPASIAADTRVVHAEPPEALRAALADRRAAALILEPSGAHYGRVPLDPAIVRAARQACDETGTLLVLDEVVTGFRVAPGGMQSLIGVRPDLSVFGKVMAGGLPGGAVAGRRELMELLAGPIAHPGTFNANPLSASAGIATLKLVADGSHQRTADGYARTLEEEWRGLLAASGVPGRIGRLSSILHVALDDRALQDRLAGVLREEGVDLLHTSAFCSSAHSLSDLDMSIAAFSRALGRLAPAAAPSG
ncbi:MAG TPA: aminotransferase class III-fold pyridoxal phosphate-dependent enzyme [Candidatus Dormibacteraeota bacterium]